MPGWLFVVRAMKTAFAIVAFLVACGDNIKPDVRPDARVYRPDADNHPFPPVPPDRFDPGDDEPPPPPMADAGVDAAPVCNYNLDPKAGMGHRECHHDRGHVGRE